MKWRVSSDLVDYETACAQMEQHVADIRSHRAEEMVWLLEHPALYTAGTSADEKDLLDPRFPVFKTGRGGEYTYHGPGQRIAYVMVDLKKRGQDIRQYVCDLEGWGIKTLAHFGITAERRQGRVGLWVKTPRGEEKIAAIGVRVRRWVTFHGMAINVCPNLEHFGGIVPCGLKDYGVTSMKELGVAVEMREVDKVLQNNFN